MEGTHKPVSLSLYFNAIYQFSENSQPACAEEIRSSLFVTVCCAGIHLQCLLELLPGVAGNLTKCDKQNFCVKIVWLSMEDVHVAHVCRDFQ